MTYQQTLDYLYARLPIYHRVGVSAYKANLDNTIGLCDLLDNPQHSFKSIHITGTNGKGSVSHMLASILQTAGFRTGLYTSPHLKDFRERIRVNGKISSKRYISSFIHKYRSHFEPLQPSFFELTVGMAFDYFREQQVDVAVVEVGLGGRLDSTNIIKPLLSVITNVSFDHMQLLGDTLEKIAIEKAGIVKPGIPVVIGETQPEIQTIFRQKASACDSDIFFADQHYRIDNFKLKGKLANYRTMDIFRDGISVLMQLKTPLAGQYQRKNITTVMGACELLNKQGVELSSAVIRSGIKDVIKNTGLKGRWQILNRNPLTICDTGHNESGLKEVLAQIEQTPHKNLHIVFGVVNDKQLAPILKLLPGNATYYFCKPDIPRGLDAADLQHQAHAAGLQGACYSSVRAAMTVAQMMADEDDLVFVGGSTFVVAEVV
ncbi:MAG: bifunctional folylpolyglutamate synthase/dihydrofolate synthase [Bacteroidetes bacterium]|nr:bifunctional folylpolyglutamate synthase/dihydrofolate synthase [Bacteroidota bacterium]